MRVNHRRKGNDQDRGSFPKRRRNSLLQGSSRSMGFKIFFLFVLVPLLGGSLLYAAKGNHNLPPPPPLSPPEGLTPLPLNGGLPHFDKIWGGKYIEDRENLRLTYTVDPPLQICLGDIFQLHRPPFTSFVALEPKTGKILALADYSRENPMYPGIWQRATYPAASIFKIITAAGALEKGLINYDSMVSFRGNQYRLGPQKLAASSKRDRRTPFAEALGKSNNVVFGRVAAKLLGAGVLRQYSEAFGFNQHFTFDFPLEISKAIIPEEPYELALCGAGFGEVTLNPLHAAMIAGCIANKGVMMRPYLIEEINNQGGEKLYQSKVEILAQPISIKTAGDLSRMMLRTVEDGTAARVFKRYGKGLLKKMAISGKTGSLSGDNPPGHYDWFIGFAPVEDPQIAFSAMVINNNHLKMKGAFIAQEALKVFFREKIN